MRHAPATTVKSLIGASVASLALAASSAAQDSPDARGDARVESRGLSAKAVAGPSALRQPDGSLLVGGRFQERVRCRLAVRPRGALTLTLGTAASSVRIQLKNRRNFDRGGTPDLPAERLGDDGRQWRVRVPSKPDRRTDRVQIRALYPDGSSVGFQVGVTTRRACC